MYHYTESGLPNVWLANGYVAKKTPYGPGVSITDADGLHKALALQITKKRGRITGKEMRFLRTMLGLSQESLATRCLGVTEQSVSLWERTGKVPQAGDALLRMLVLEKLNGNVKLSKLLDQFNDVDRMINQKIVLRESRHRWISESVPADQAVLAS